MSCEWKGYKIKTLRKVIVLPQSQSRTYGKNRLVNLWWDAWVNALFRCSAQPLWIMWCGVVRGGFQIPTTKNCQSGERFHISLLPLNYHDPILILNLNLCTLLWLGSVWLYCILQRINRVFIYELLIVSQIITTTWIMDIFIPLS